MNSSHLWTKLVPPSTSGLLLPRDHLAGKLANIEKKRLTLVTAPAGYGKTSVLVSAFNKLKADGKNPGWISLDHDDNDLGRFLSYWCSAADLEHPHAGQSASVPLSAGVRAPLRLLTSEFINSLHALERPSFIFLDDYHLVSEPAILALVNEVLRLPLDFLHLVIATRDSKSLSLGRLRVHDQLQTINAQELGLSIRETRELFLRVSRIEVLPEHIGRIREKTEGWATGVQLAAIAMRDRENGAQFIETFSGEHGSVADFLADEVFRLQPVEIQDFLLATSILTRFNASLSEAVSAKSNAGDILKKLENANLFIFCLDEERNWYRYHHLFQEFLRKKLREEFASLQPVLHERASAWFAGHGFGVESIEHALSAGKVLQAAQLLNLNSHNLISSGRTAELMSFASRLPAELLDQMPGALLDQAWQLMACWRFKETRVSLDRVGKVIEQRAETTTTDAQRQELSFLRSKLSHRELVLSVTRDDLAATLQMATEWLVADRTNEPVMRATASSIALQARREFYRCEGIAASSKALRELFVEGGGYFTIVYHECVSGATFFARGDIDTAEQHYRGAQKTAIEIHGEHSALSSFPSAMLAELLYERNNLAEAAQLLRTHPMSAEFGLVDKLIAGFITRARLASLRGCLEEAESALDDASYFAAEYEFDRLHAHVLNERVRMLIAHGEARLVGKLLSEPRYQALLPVEVSPKEGVTTTNELFAMAHARAWMAAGRASEAVALLRQWVGFCKVRHCLRSAIRLSMLLASGYLSDGNRLAARRTLMDALKMGEGRGFVRSYLDENEEVVNTLSELGALPESQQPFDRRHLNEILTAAKPAALSGGSAHVEPPATGSAIRTQLSDRELQIIRLAAQGLPNLDIAGSMCLAESTVKWYWQRIFDKLDVRRRSDAVKQARQLHWIK
ncbi:LuxR C-terminal-related transcriptional regulator [Paraburkholderia caffeinilytica]|uniref:LuxR C-terminal-related transcriptional regulator n=1 Tax=Paraburkholderia caffeinilytica TaxID=1761016 RepID=UPI0038BCF6E8